MTIERFIQENRSEIDARVGTCRDDDDRELWVLNDESLYLWALRVGVEDI